MERHRRFTLSSPLSCNTGLVFCNDAPLSLQPSLQALFSSVPTPWLMAPSQKSLQITAGAPLSSFFEGKYPALIWGVAAEDRAAGDEEANVEDVKEEMKKVTGGAEDTHGGTAAEMGPSVEARRVGASATPSASKTPRRTNHHYLLQHCGIVSNLKI